eukprot:5531643-Amphidinium_carterae.1
MPNPDIKSDDYYKVVRRSWHFSCVVLAVHLVEVLGVDRGASDSEIAKVFNDNDIMWCHVAPI